MLKALQRETDKRKAAWDKLHPHARALITVLMVILILGGVVGVVVGVLSILKSLGHG